MNNFLLYKYSNFHKIRIPLEQKDAAIKWCEDNISERSFIIKNSIGGKSWGLVFKDGLCTLYVENELDAIAIKLIYSS